jgi:hypothetical protein
MPPAKFEPAIPANERLQTYALDRAATEIGYSNIVRINIQRMSVPNVYVSGKT